MMKGHARSLMTPHATTVTADAPLLEVARALVVAGFAGVPVVGAEGELVGFLSELDLAQAMLDGRFDGKVKDVMSTRIVSVDEFAPTDDVIRALREHRIHHLPVVRQGTVVGVITPNDVIRHFLEAGDDVA
jgi:CBS domain-containing protein